MASRLHSKKKHTKTKKKNQKEKQKQQQPKKWKNKESFPLTRCWRHVLWADDVKLLLSAQGKLKPKHLSLFIMGGGRERMKGGSHGFQGNRVGGETVIANRVQRGGGAIRHWLPMRGIIKILQRFRGGKVNFSVIRQKSSYPSLGNIYSDWSQTWQSLHGWQYTKKQITGF